MNTKTGFTLIELLVAIAIIGLLAGAILTTLTGVSYRARASYVAQTTKTIEQAFILKGLDDQINTWWEITDFPIDSEWDEVVDVQQLIDEAALGEFLPILPEGLPSDEPDDFGHAPYEFTFAYQNYFPTSPIRVDPDPSECYNEYYTHNVSNFYATQNGISLIIRPDYDYQTAKFRKTFESLDAYFDDSDGQNCGRFRIITYPNWLAMYIFTLDENNEFNY